MSLPDLVVLSLATYRLARLIAVDEGPFQVFFRLRYLAGAYDLGENGQPVSAWGRGISCPHCVGVYAALGLWLFSLLSGADHVIFVLAIAGAQSALWSLVGK